MLQQRPGGYGSGLSPRNGDYSRVAMAAEEAGKQARGDMFSRASVGSAFQGEGLEPLQASAFSAAPAPTASPRALSQRELSEAISVGVADALSRLGLVDKHSEVLEAVSRVTVQPTDLSPIMRGITQLMSLKDSHSEVLEAITNVTVEQPDLTPIMRAITQLSLQESRPKEMEAVTNVVVEPPDLSAMHTMMLELQADVKRSVDGLRQDIQEDLSVLQQELLKNRSETRNDAEVLLAEVQTGAQVLLAEVQSMPRDLEDLRTLVQRLDKKSDSEHAEVMRALTEKHLEVMQGLTEVMRGLTELANDELDLPGIANAVHDRLLRTKLRVDNSDVLLALKGLELDQPVFANLVVDKMRKQTFLVDNTEVLAAIRRLPEQEAISRSVQNGLVKVLPDRNDFAELLETVRRIKREPDLTPVIAALHAAEIDFNPILDAVGKIRLDHGPVLDALRRMELLDAEGVGRVVSDRLRRADLATSEELATLLGAVRMIPEPQKFDTNLMLQEITKIGAGGDIIRSIGSVQVELRRLGEFLASSTQQRVVQTVGPPAVVKQVLQQQPTVVMGQPTLMQQPTSAQLMQTQQVPLMQTQQFVAPRSVSPNQVRQVSAPVQVSAPSNIVAAKEEISPQIFSPRVVSETYGTKVDYRTAQTTTPSFLSNPQTMLPSSSGSGNYWSANALSPEAMTVTETISVEASGSISEQTASCTPMRPSSFDIA